MADNTKIEWADATLNYANGCSLASPGCTNCYAMKQAHRFPVRQGLTQQSKGGMVWTGEVRINDKALQQALAWKRGRRIFWNAHGDLFHENVPDKAIDRQFAACWLSPQHIHMILTKRSARMREYCDGKTSQPGASAVADAIKELGGGPSDQLAFMEHMAEHSCLPNVWLGVSVEDQQRADERVPDLVAITAAVRFISAEPLLGPVYLTRWLRQLRWIIVGGESGPKARPMHPDWLSALRNQCRAAQVPFLFKQWGEFAPVEYVESEGENFDYRFTDGSGRLASQLKATRWEEEQGADFVRVGKKAAGRLLDGREWSEFPT